MSTDLYYSIPTKDNHLGKDLKYILEPILWGHDGTLGGEDVFVHHGYKFWDEETQTHVRLQDFLLGVSKGKGDEAKQAEKLMKLLDKHEDGIFLSLKG